MDMITPAIHEAARPAVEAAVSMAALELGNRLRAIYALGSLGYGGYVPGWSDIDLDLIIIDSVKGRDAELRDVGRTMSARLEKVGFAGVDVRCYTLPDLNAPSTVHEYGIAVRSVMLLDSAQCIYGEDIRGEIARPTIERLRDEAKGIMSGMLKKDAAWWDCMPDDDLAAFMALPCRMLFTAENGAVVGKSAAIEWFASRYGNELSADVWPWVAWARACRASAALRRPPNSILPTARRAAREFMSWALRRLEAL
jgi:hypothetical protein